MSSKKSDPLQNLYDLLMHFCTEENNRVRVENILSSAGALIGEWALRAAGDFDLDDHTGAPGQAVFSDKVNDILLKDSMSKKADFSDLPAKDSVLYNIFLSAKEFGFAKKDFPNVVKSLEFYAENLNHDAFPWGFVPLDVAQENFPDIPPLQAAYSLRDYVKAIFAEAKITGTDSQLMHLTMMGSIFLRDTKQAIAPATSLQILVGTVIGMSKQYPFLQKHMDEVQNNLGSYQ